jgi:hypothetical protein
LVWSERFDSLLDRQEIHQSPETLLVEWGRGRIWKEPPWSPADPSDAVAVPNHPYWNGVQVHVSALALLTNELVDGAAVRVSTRERPRGFDLHHNDAISHPIALFPFHGIRGRNRNAVFRKE